MRALTLALACLACGSYARRTQSEVPKAEEQDLQAKEALATTLFAANPALAPRLASGASVSAQPAIQRPTPPEDVRAKPSVVQMASPEIDAQLFETGASASQADAQLFETEALLAGVEPKPLPEAPQADAGAKPRKRSKILKKLLTAGLVAGSTVMRASPAVAAASVGVNQAGAGAGFFANLRVPATLLTGTALGALFVDIKDHNGAKYQYLRTAYQFFAAMTIAFELSCVFMSTTMGVRLLAGGFDPVATSAVAFLRREFEFEYIACRLAFFTGILSFLSLIGLRIWLTLAEKEPMIAKGFVFLLGSLALYFDAFWRHTVVNYGGYFEMLGRLIYLFFFNFLPKQPFQSKLLMFGCAAASVVSFGIGFKRSHLRAKAAAEGEGK